VYGAKTAETLLALSPWFRTVTVCGLVLYYLFEVACLPFESAIKAGPAKLSTSVMRWTSIRLQLRTLALRIAEVLISVGLLKKEHRQGRQRLCQPAVREVAIEAVGEMVGVVDKDFSQADHCYWLYKTMSAVVIESY